MSDENKTILTRANAEVAKGNNEGFLSYCTEDVVWEFVGEQTLKGKAAVRRYMSETYIAPPRFVISSLIADGDMVAALGDIILKDNDGRDVEHAFCDVWRVRGGKLAELRAFVVAVKKEG
jgi:uncharacterized protein